MPRFTLATVLTLWVCATAIQAQVYIPSNTPSLGRCNVFPWATRSSRYQTIISKAFLGSTPFKVTDVAFAPCSAAPFVATNLRIRMCHTTLSDFTSALNFEQNMGPAPVTVHSGPGSWTATLNTWSSVNHQCSFGYDGKRNILMEICFDGQSSGPTCRTDRLPRLFATGLSCSGLSTGQTDSGGPKLRLSVDRQCVLLVPDTAKVGQTLATKVVQAPPGLNYQSAASLGMSNVLKLGNASICLNLDALFFASIAVGPPIFTGYAGSTGSGTYLTQLTLPLNQGLIGLRVYHASVVLGRAGVVCTTNTAATALVP